jgi:hypothetical protein
MATPNKVEVVLSFKPLMDGLNRFVAGYQARMAQVQALNQRIQNGEAALQRMVSQVGVVVGAAALASYAREARAADRIQQQLNRTLERTGETGAADALNAQAAALQRVTAFSDETVTTVQRLLISFGLTAQQALGMTELVLDLAQETGQSAESAAMLIGRTLRGETDELGRLNIKLDTTKGKVDAIREALQRFAAGAARGAVADKAGRDVEARYADATEQLGRAANQVAIPFIQALIPLLERLAAGATALAERLTPIAPMLGDMAAAALPAVAGLALLSGAVSFLTMLVNPLRAAVVLFAGRSLLELSNALAKSTGGAAGLWSTLKNGGGVLAGLGSALTVVASVATAFFAGWQLGTILNEIEVSGLKIKDWAALWVVAVQDTIGGAFSWLRVAWTNTKFTLMEGMNELLLWIREKQLQIQEGLNATLSRVPGVQLYDTKALRGEVENLRQKIGELEQARVAAVAAIKGERSKQASENADLMLFMQGNGPAGPARGSGGGATPARPDLNGGKFGVTEKDQLDRIRRKNAEDLFALETEMMRAEAAGDKQRVDQLKEYLRFKQLEQEMEGASADLIMERVAAEKTLEGQQRRRQEAEQEHSRRIAAGEAALALVEESRFLTEEQKNQVRIVLLGKINELIRERLTLLEREQAAMPSPERQMQIDQLRQQQGQNAASITAAQPLGHGQSMIAGMVQFLREIPTLAQRAQQAVYSIATAFSQGVANSITGLINRTMTWRDALLNVGTSVVNGIIAAFANMAAQWIAQQIMMALFGKAIQAAQIAALAPIASATALLWAPAATAASIATLGGAAIEGAAMAKMAIVSSALGLASGGLVTGPGTGTSDSILTRLSNGEFVVRAAAVRQFGPGFFESLNQGAIDLASISGRIGSQIPSAAAPTRAGAETSAAAAGGDVKVNVAVFYDETAAMRWLDRQSGRKILYKRVNQDRAEMGLEG